MSFHIMGTGSALPARVVTNEDLSQFLDTSDEWIVERTGIRTRHVCVTEELDELAAEAARAALADAGVSAEELDLIVGTTCSSEHTAPAVACAVRQLVGASCPAFDVNGACAGFVYALDAADGWFARGRARRVLVVSAEKLSRCVDWTDRATCVLFGDGAAAAVLGEGGDSPLYTNLTCQDDYQAITIPIGAGNSPFDEGLRARQEEPEQSPYLHQRGREVFKFAVTHIVSELRLLSERTGVALSDVDHFVFHQANRRIIDAGVERLGIDPAKVAITIDHAGNVSSACIPLSLDELSRAGRLRDGELVALFGFGAGLVTGAMLVRWQKGLGDGA